MSNRITDTIKGASAAFVLIFGASLATAPAFAAGPQDKADRRASTFAFAFKYQPEELQTEAGAQRLLARLQKQVHRGCRIEAQDMQVDKKDIADCVDRTMQSNITRFQSTSLANAYKNRTDG